MGIIYKATCKLTSKVYIGQSKTSLKQRVGEHKGCYNNPDAKEYDYRFYRAMRKWGFENFVFEVIENCDNEKLDERERYYIKKYRSTFKGYNETLGGRGNNLFTEKHVKAWKVLYDNKWILDDISEVFDCSISTVSKKLKDCYGIDTVSNGNYNKRDRVSATDKEGNSMIFESKIVAAQFLIDNHYCKTTNPISVVGKISVVTNKENRSAYGFKWITIE